jgi:hypothetical protein
MSKDARSICGDTFAASRRLRSRALSAIASRRQRHASRKQTLQCRYARQRRRINAVLRP